MIQTLSEDEAWEVMSSFNAFYNDLKNKDEKHPKYYYKVVRQTSAIKWDPEEYKQVYNDPFVKRYFVALMKKQWGMNLIKFRGTKLPGGIELNGREIYDDGVRELEEIKSRMMMDYETPPLDFIG